MSDVDRKRIAAVQILDAMCYTWKDRAWVSATGARAVGVDLPGLLLAADALHDEVAERIEELAGTLDESDEEEELERLTNLVEGYRAVRPKV